MDDDKIERDLRDLQEQMDDIKERVNKIENELMKEIYKTRDNSSKEISEVKSRLSEIEKELGIEERNRDMLAIGSTKMARVAAMEEDERKKELKTSLFRATIVWENFDDWSKYVPHYGRVIKSGEIMRYLSTHLNEDLTWSQTYRVMDSFEENTSDIFWQENSDELGKILVRQVG